MPRLPAFDPSGNLRLYSFEATAPGYALSQTYQGVAPTPGENLEWFDFWLEPDSDDDDDDDDD